MGCLIWMGALQTIPWLFPPSMTLLTEGGKGSKPTAWRHIKSAISSHDRTGSDELPRYPLRRKRDCLEDQSWWMMILASCSFPLKHLMFLSSASRDVLLNLTLFWIKAYTDTNASAIFISNNGLWLFRECISKFNTITNLIWRISVIMSTMLLIKMIN